MTDNKSNTKKPTPSKVHNLASAMLEFQKLSVTAKKMARTHTSEVTIQNLSLLLKQ